MPSVEDELLSKLCGRKETLKSAQALLHLAKAKTAPGSGHELGQGATGLPAICAYIASEDLGNADVNQKVAQTASCLAPRIFTTTLNIVRNALAESEDDTASPSRTLRSKSSVTYQTLVEQHHVKMADRVVSWMEDVQNTILKDKRRKLDGKSPLFKCAVFFWVCHILELKRITAKLLVSQNRLDKAAFDNFVALLDDKCEDQNARILQEVADLKAQAKVRSPSKASVSPSKASVSPSKASVSPSKASAMPLAQSPSKASPTKAKVAPKGKEKDTTAFVAALASPRKSALKDRDPSASPDKKRKVAFSAHLDLTPETPTRKRRRVEDHVPTPAVEEDVGGSGSSDTDSDDVQGQPKRFRPVLLDSRQWYQRDPILRREWAKLSQTLGLSTAA